MMSEKKIEPDMTVEEVVEKYPQAVGFLMDKGIMCMICGEPVWGTLGELIAEKGLDVRTTIDELNSDLDK